MKIVREGQIPEDIEHRLTCIHCKTVFTCTKKEAIYSGGGNDWCYIIPCPLCGQNCSFGGQPQNNYSWYDR